MTITTGTFTGESGDQESFIENNTVDGGGDITSSDVEIDYTGYLKRITVALETIAAEITTIDSNIDRLRILADWKDYTDEEAIGFGIRTAGTSAYNNIEKATLYKSLILEGGILTYRKDSAEQNLANSEVNPPAGIRQASIDRIADLADEFDQVAPGVIPARDLPDPFEGNF